MKTLEIVFKDNQESRLTITPTRITIKIKENLLPEQVERIVEFCKYVNGQNEMQNAEISFRGKIITSNNKLKITMFNDRKTVSYNYYE